MNKEKWLDLEYQSLREEIKYRIGFLHQTINLAIIVLALFMVIVFIFILIGATSELVTTFLLTAPIILCLICFNYQSNQNSLETISKYIEEVIKPSLGTKLKDKVLGWNQYFANQKKPYRYESVTKIFPFIAPSFVPFYVILAGTQLEKYQWVIIIVNFILIAIMIEHFRYKLRRVK